MSYRPCKLWGYVKCYTPVLSPLILKWESSAPSGRFDRTCTSTAIMVSSSRTRRVWLVVVWEKTRGGGGRIGWGVRMAGGTSSSTGSFTLSLISDTTCEELGTPSFRRPSPWDHLHRFRRPSPLDHLHRPLTIYIDLGGQEDPMASYGRCRRPSPWDHYMDFGDWGPGSVASTVVIGGQGPEAAEFRMQWLEDPRLP